MTLYTNSSSIYIKLHHPLSHLTYQKWRKKKKKKGKKKTQRIFTRLENKNKGATSDRKRRRNNCASPVVSKTPRQYGGPRETLLLICRHEATLKIIFLAECFD